MINFFKKYHKWLGIILAYFIIAFVISGVVLNHRETFSGIDVNRNLLPKEYRYKNWNNAAVKSTLKINNDSILIYGNIGIWKTDSNFNKFTDFNIGFPKGSDNRKICRMFQTNSKDILAGTFFGLYKYSKVNQEWEFLKLPVSEKRITDIIEKQDTVIILTRSHLVKTVDYKKFETLQLPPPENYDNKVGLFKTLWVIHSGEIYGTIGKLIVDIVGVIFAFLTITGIIIFYNKIILKKNKKSQRIKRKLKLSNRWNLKWHNKIGWITTLILIITTVTGIFLRPPLLIAIGNSRVDKIPHTELNDPNPWFDVLRRVLYNPEKDRYLIATKNGFYYSDDNFRSELKRYKVQPPASIMGVTVLKKINNQLYLIGSFEGLFTWNPEQGEIFDYITKEKYTPPKKKGRPIGQFLVTGYSDDYKNQEIYFEYNSGAAIIGSKSNFIKMPKNIIKESPMPLWIMALEIHTARIYQNFLGYFYVLIVPLTGFAILFILISGFIVWYVKFRKKFR